MLRRRMILRWMVWMVMWIWKWTAISRQHAKISTKSPERTRRHLEYNSQRAWSSRPLSQAMSNDRARAQVAVTRLVNSEGRTLSLLSSRYRSSKKGNRCQRQHHEPSPRILHRVLKHPAATPFILRSRALQVAQPQDCRFRSSCLPAQQVHEWTRRLQEQSTWSGSFPRRRCRCISGSWRTIRG